MLEINKLKTLRKDEITSSFHVVNKLLKAVEENGESQEDLIRKEFSRFYDCCLSYIELWENSFGDGEQFVWLAKSIFDWSDMGATAEKINETVANAVFNFDDLFDEVVLAKTFLLSRSAEAEWKDEDCEEKWVKVFCHFKHQNISVGNLRKVMKYIFCLPGTSTFAERTFSMMKTIWSEEKSTMKKSTVEGLLICKLGIGLSCSEFCKEIRNNKQFLKKVHSSEKYERSNTKANGF